MPIQIGQEHAASALASSLPQGMTIASNAGTQPQKRTDRVQVKLCNFFNLFARSFSMLMLSVNFVCYI